MKYGKPLFDEIWFEIWNEDKKSIITLMYKNMAADLEVGYDPMGNSIKKQKADIEEYTRAYENALEAFKTMEDEKIERWCFFDLVKCGAIDI